MYAGRDGARRSAMPIDSNFGDRLAAAMKSANMQRRDVEKLCNVSKTTVARWLKMREARLEARYALSLAAAVNTDLHWLLTGEAKNTDVSA
jgi:transcriptional regulator with XRE-family HTH domain